MIQLKISNPTELGSKECVYIPDSGASHYFTSDEFKKKFYNINHPLVRRYSSAYGWKFWTRPDLCFNIGVSGWTVMWANGVPHKEIKW